MREAAELTNAILLTSETAPKLKINKAIDALGDADILAVDAIVKADDDVSAWK